ncbi:hypothetical protein [Butyricimonas faecihominis]|uniref:hypothetical protein n=2 Tax=Bacteroidia TaxID=200643 RepID=UPI0032C18E97
MRRMLSTIFSVAREQFPPVSAAHTSRIGMLTAPTAKSSKKRPTVSVINMENNIVERERIYFSCL